MSRVTAPLLRGYSVPHALIAIAAVVLAVAAHVFVAWGSTLPIFYDDEVGYLANAQSLSGVGAPRDLSGSSYYIGWSILLTPLWWISQNPQHVYFGALCLSVAIGIATIVPLAAIARRFGLSAPWHIVAAAAISLAPGRLLMSNFALVENLLAFLAAAALWAAIRFADSPSLGRALALTAITSYLFVSHARTLGFLVATIVWILFVCWRRWKTVVASLAIAALIVVPTTLIYRAIVGTIYSSSVDREQTGLSRLATIDPLAAITTTIGQLWYAAAAWYGLAALGLILVVLGASRELRARKFSVFSWSLLVVVASFVASVVWIGSSVGRGDQRLDIFAYGRYVDTVLFLLALFGVSALVRGLSKRVTIAWATAVVIVSGLLFAVVVPRVPTEDSPWWVPVNVAGLVNWDWPYLTDAAGPPWIAATIFLVVATAVLAGLSRTPERFRQGAIVGTVLVAFAVSGVVGELKTVRPMWNAWYDSFTVRADINRLIDELPEASISLDSRGFSKKAGGADTVSRNAMQLFVAPRDLPVFDSEERLPETDFVISRKDWPEGERLGARLVSLDTGLFDNALWVMPGDVLDELESRGELKR